MCTDIDDVSEYETETDIPIATSTKINKVILILYLCNDCIGIIGLNNLRFIISAVNLTDNMGSLIVKDCQCCQPARHRTPFTVMVTVTTNPRTGNEENSDIPLSTSLSGQNSNSESITTHVWFVSNKIRNRLMHAMNGNSSSKKERKSKKGQKPSQKTSKKSSEDMPLDPGRVNNEEDKSLEDLEILEHRDQKHSHVGHTTTTDRIHENVESEDSQDEETHLNLTEKINTTSMLNSMKKNLLILQKPGLNFTGNIEVFDIIKERINSVLLSRPVVLM